MSSVTELALSRDEPVRADHDTLLIPLRLPWYRSLPLSAVEHLAITIDDQTFADDQLSLVVGGVEHAFEALRQAHDTYWFVQDTAWARVAATPAQGDVHLHVESAVRIPYLMVGPDKAVVRHIVEDSTRPVEGERA